MGRNKQSLKLLSDLIGKRNKKEQGNEGKTKVGKGLKLMPFKCKRKRNEEEAQERRKRRKERKSKVVHILRVLIKHLKRSNE